MQKVIILFLIFIIVFMFFTGLFFFYEARFMSGRAASGTNFSIDNSTVVPILRQAYVKDGQKIRVYVYVYTDQGTGAFGRKVEISNPDKLNIIVDQAEQQTGQDGIVYFDISSKISGEFDLEVKVDGFALPSKAHLKFI